MVGRLELVGLGRWAGGQTSRKGAEKVVQTVDSKDEGAQGEGAPAALIDRAHLRPIDRAPHTVCRTVRSAH